MLLLVGVFLVAAAAPAMARTCPMKCCHHGQGAALAAMPCCEVTAAPAASPSAAPAGALAGAGTPIARLSPAPSARLLAEEPLARLEVARDLQALLCTLRN